MHAPEGLRRTVRRYPSTTVYICVMVTIIFLMQCYLIWKDHQA